MRLFLCVLFLFSAACVARADSLSFAGMLDPNNSNDVYLATFQVTSASNVVFQSYGYGGSSNAPGGTNANGAVISAGGFDTYFSLFQGTGTAATFLASNDDDESCVQAVSVDGYCGDSRLAVKLAAGSYTLALTQSGNMSLAENYGAGTLGDGFIDLAHEDYSDYYGRSTTADFAFDITGDAVTDGGTTTPPMAETPEPPSMALMTLGVVLTVTACRRQRRLLA